MKTRNRPNARPRRTGRRTAAHALMQDRPERIAAMESLRRNYYEATTRTPKPARTERGRG